MHVDFFMGVSVTILIEWEIFRVLIGDPRSNCGKSASLPSEGPYSNCSMTISGLDPSRSGGPQVPAPLEVKTCILPMRLRP